MNTVETLIQSPPPGSQISSEQRGGAFVFTGKSQGIPLKLFSPRELGTMEKALEIKAKLTSKPSEGNVGDLLAQQVFDWSIEISNGRVTFSSASLPDDYQFTRQDVRRLSQAPGGSLAVELTHLEGDHYKTQVLTRNLGADDATWLHRSLIQLFDLEQDGVAKPQAGGLSPMPPTASFKIVEQAGGSRVEIQHHTKVLHRILPLIIGELF